MLRQPLNIDLSTLVLTHFQSLPRSLLSFDKQVLHLLIVDLKHTHLHLVLNTLIRISPNSLEYLVARLWDDALVFAMADHGV